MATYTNYNLTGSGFYSRNNPGLIRRAEYVPKQPVSQQTPQQTQQVVDDEEKRKRRRTGWIIFGIIAGIIVLVIIGIVIFLLVRNNSNNNPTPAPAQGSLNDPCSENQPCLILFACQDGLCKSNTGGPCLQDSDCNTLSFNNVCSQNQCRRPNGTACNENGQCVSNRCDTNTCAACLIDTDCPTGFTCDLLTGNCMPTG